MVTSHEDEKTIALCHELSKTMPLHCHRTNVFWARKAKFNKWAAVEEGLDVMGRYGWISIIDADIAIQFTDSRFMPRIGNLYTPIRLIQPDVRRGIPPLKEWCKMSPAKVNEEFSGYFQLFHANDPAISLLSPWHNIDWTWAGGAGREFTNRWSEEKKVRPPFRCLHVGEPFKNWCGRATPFVDGTLHEKAQERREQAGILRRQMKDRKLSYNDGYKGDLS